jgi:hypothetical protein
MAVSSPIVVSEASSIDWMSLRSVWRAVESALFDVEDEGSVSLESVPVSPVVPHESLEVELELLDVVPVSLEVVLELPEVVLVLDAGVMLTLPAVLLAMVSLALAAAVAVVEVVVPVVPVLSTWWT